MKRNNVQNKLKTIQNRIAELNDDLELVQTNTSEEIWKQHIIETITHDINILQQQQDKFALVAKRLTKKNEEDSSTEKFLEESDDRIFFS